MNIHSGQVTQEFYDRLMTHIENTKAQSEQMSTSLSKDDIKLETLDTVEQQGMANSGISGPQALLVRLKDDRWIRIRVDVRTGRVVVREVGKTGDGVDGEFPIHHASYRKASVSNLHHSPNAIFPSSRHRSIPGAA